MRLVEITASLFVNPEDVATVTIPDRSDFVRVALRTGETFNIGPDYSKSVWQTQTRIVAALRGDDA